MMGASTASILRRDRMRSSRTTLGAEVLIAGSVVDSVQQIRQSWPHVSVGDIGIPDVDGYQLLRQIRVLGSASGGSLSAIALTAFVRPEDRTRALSAGHQIRVSKAVEASQSIVTVAIAAGKVGTPST